MATSSAQNGPLLPDLLPIDRADVQRSAEGVVYIWTPAPNLVVTRSENRFTSQAARAVEIAWRRAATGRPLVCFNDWEGMTEYDTATRIHLTNVGLDLRSSSAVFHILAGSKIVVMGLHAAKIFLKDSLIVYHSRGELEQRLRQSLLASRAP